MVDHISGIEDREERNRAARTLIGIMGNLNPLLREQGDFKHKLWDHLIIISDFRLDIDSPYEKPEPSQLFEKPNRIPYNQNRIKYKHYGRSLELMLKKALEMEEGEEKEQLIAVLANHMKKSYLTWNREAVDDQQIFSDLKELSGGRIENSDDMIKFLETKEILNKNRKKRPQRKSK